MTGFYLKFLLPDGKLLMPSINGLHHPKPSKFDVIRLGGDTYSVKHVVHVYSRGGSEEILGLDVHVEPWPGWVP